MYSKLSLHPYKKASESARLLSKALSQSLGRTVRRLRTDHFYPLKSTSCVIGWGAHETPWWLPGRYLNRPMAVKQAHNKLVTFANLQGKVLIPQWTTEKTIAHQWWDQGKIVLCRKSLTGSAGAGIIISRVEHQCIVDAPLYVQYKSKQKEFRVHVFRQKVIDVSEKRRSVSHGPVESDYIRSRENGWIFCHDAILEPEGLRSVSMAAVSVLGLDFGAVDVIWNEDENRCYVLEVNTAPGIEGTTLEKYTNAILEWSHGYGT